MPLEPTSLYGCQFPTPEQPQKLDEVPGLKDLVPPEAWKTTDLEQKEFARSEGKRAGRRPSRGTHLSAAEMESFLKDHCQTGLGWGWGSALFPAHALVPQAVIQNRTDSDKPTVLRDNALPNTSKERCCGPAAIQQAAQNEAIDVQTMPSDHHGEGTAGQ